MILRRLWSAQPETASGARVKRPSNYTFVWWCNDDHIKQVTILSTVPKCEWKSWISDSVQQLVVVQIRCADVKPLWESEREKTLYSWITHVFTDDWFNLLVYVDLFTHLTYMLLYIQYIFAGIFLINSKAAGMSKTMQYTHNPPHNSGQD